MTPYTRFRTISNFVTTALVVGAVYAVWPVASDLIATATGGQNAAYWGATGLVAMMTILFSLTVSGAIFPFLFRMGFLRRMVLGQHYLEGLWIQAEHDDENGNRLTVIQVKPQGYGYAFSGEAFDRTLNVMSQSPYEMMKAGPLDISYAYATLPGGDGERSDTGKGHLSFRPFRGRALAYSGYGQSDLMRNSFRIEGLKVRKWSELRRLQKRDQRADVLAAYWEKFFCQPAELAEDLEAPESTEAFEPPAIRRPVIVESAAASAFDRRRDHSEMPEGTVVHRRRATDWRAEDTTPTADRIRARMMEETVKEEVKWDQEAAEDAEASLDDGSEESLEDEVSFEDESEPYGEETTAEEEEEYDAEEDFEDEAEEDYAEADDEDLETEDEYEAAGEEDGPGEDEPPMIRHRYARR